MDITLGDVLILVSIGAGVVGLLGIIVTVARGWQRVIDRVDAHTFEEADIIGKVAEENSHQHERIVHQLDHIGDRLDEHGERIARLEGGKREQA